MDWKREARPQAVGWAGSGRYSDFRHPFPCAASDDSSLVAIEVGASNPYCGFSLRVALFAPAHVCRMKAGLTKDKPPPNVVR